MLNNDKEKKLIAPEVAVLVKYGQEVAYIAHFGPFLDLFNQFWPTWSENKYPSNPTPFHLL